MLKSPAQVARDPARLPEGDSAKSLQHVWRQARRLKRLSALVHALLPTEFQNSVSVVQARSHSLTLATPSSEWAARLRYELPLLQRQLKGLQEFHGLRDIHLTVAPPPQSSTNTQVDRQLGAEAARSLTAAANSVALGPLQEALRSLARLAPATVTKEPGQSARRDYDKGSGGSQ